MSFIYATDNFNTKTWSLTTDNLSSGHADLFFIFTEEAPVIEFDNLKFGYSLKQNDVEIQTNTFPPEGTEYVRSDQDYLIAERLTLIPEADHILYLWCENGGIFFEESFTITTPRPTQPFDSWSWNSDKKIWEAPTAMPDDGDMYFWDESTLSWHS